MDLTIVIPSYGTGFPMKECHVCQAPSSHCDGVFAMKKIEAIIRHFKLDDVKAALTKQGVQGMTVSEVRGCGHSPGTNELYRGQEYAVDFQPRVKVEVVVADEACEETLRAIVQAARTGQVGDGRIFISKLEDVVRVRTGETGSDAI